MTRKWFIGTATPSTSADAPESQVKMDLAVEISEEEHDSFLSAVHQVRKMERGALFRLVFRNHQALADHLALLEDALKSERRGIDWQEAHLQLQLAIANWLSSVRWLLDHTKSRLSNDNDKSERFKEATRKEFDGHSAYRLTYKLRDYVTHCDLPPLALEAQSVEEAPGKATHSLRVELEPTQLLDSWNGWTAPVRRDLRDSPGPIEVMALADEAMECIKRIMLAIVAGDLPDHQAHARLVLDAVSRLGNRSPLSDGGLCLVAIELRDGSITKMTPTPLPVEEALRLLRPPG